MIDRQHSAFDIPCQCIHFFGRASEGIGRKAVGRPICLCDHFAIIGETTDQDDWAEGFFVHDGRRDGNIGQHRRSKEIPGIADPVTAGS